MEMRLVAPVTPEVLFFLSALRASLTRLRYERSVSIRKKYPLEPRVYLTRIIILKNHQETGLKTSSLPSIKATFCELTFIVL